MEYNNEILGCAGMFYEELLHNTYRAPHECKVTVAEYCKEESSYSWASLWHRMTKAGTVMDRILDEQCEKYRTVDWYEGHIMYDFQATLVFPTHEEGKEAEYIENFVAYLEHITRTASVLADTFLRVAFVKSKENK
jgi:hypothetical protein